MKDSELLSIVNKAIKRFKGDSGELGSAIGMLFLGARLGWRPLLVMYSRITIKKYEKYLGISIREVLPEEGAMAHRSVGYEIAKRAANFWKIVRGEVPDTRTPELN